MSHCDPESYLWAWHGGSFDPDENVLLDDIAWAIGQKTEYPVLMLDVGRIEAVLQG